MLVLVDCNTMIYCCRGCGKQILENGSDTNLVLLVHSMWCLKTNNTDAKQTLSFPLEIWFASICHHYTCRIMLDSTNSRYKYDFFIKDQEPLDKDSQYNHSIELHQLYYCNWELRYILMTWSDLFCNCLCD